MDAVLQFVFNHWYKIDKNADGNVSADEYQYMMRLFAIIHAHLIVTGFGMGFLVEV